MDYQYDKEKDCLTIQFSGLSSPAGNSAQLLAGAEHPGIQLILSEDGKLSGLEISTASVYFDKIKLDNYAPRPSGTPGNQTSGFHALSPSEFTELDCPTLFHDKENDSFFGYIQKGNFSFKFGWVRETSTPSITWLSQNSCALGLDKNFAMIDFNAGEVRSNIALDTYFVGTYPTTDALLVATQLEVLALDLFTYEILSTTELPDFLVSMDTDQRPYTAHCFDGSSVKVQ
ncbi:hypothetical protein SAMN05192529_101386 [Arachidicoccus rhizosphaerae]|uniref:Uncharacterized protein n=1 Tax=Arachidicoccus rhizosphaerae TaxID=551991 RepID=A0A1H3VT62_9BACT|nr:hypothetical protein [Arachidicoccus rhizosphaerae]SDZ77302.1 hypothetical protein SAMN05192529_101386 [Arachidicoccus rhizosphaerae]